MKGDGITLTPASSGSCQISGKKDFLDEVALHQRVKTSLHDAPARMLRELIDQLFHAREKLLFGARVVGEA